jgi:hypothetical protein
MSYLRKRLPHAVFTTILAWCIWSSVGAARLKADGHEGDHTLYDFCDGCNCCDGVFIPCSQAHPWVCSFSGNGCSVHPASNCNSSPGV